RRELVASWVEQLGGRDRLPRSIEATDDQQAVFVCERSYGMAITRCHEIAIRVRDRGDTVGIDGDRVDQTDRHGRPHRYTAHDDDAAVRAEPSRREIDTVHAGRPGCLDAR